MTALTPMPETLSAESGAERTATPLTNRELAVLRLIAEGQSTRQLAQTLGVTFKTANCHREHIMAKLDLHNIAGLVRYAIRTGLIEA